MPKNTTKSRAAQVSTASKSGGISKVMRTLMTKSYGSSRAYVVEYGLLLVLIGALLGLVSTMLQSIFEYSSSASGDRWFLGGEYGMSVNMLAAAIIIVPLVFVLIQRTAEVERKNPHIKNSSWRKGLLGVFVAVTGVIGLISGIGLLSTVLLAATLTSVSLSFGGFMSALSATAIFVAAAWTFGQDYRSDISQQNNKWLHYFRYSLVIGSVVVMALFMVLPMTQQQDAQERQQRRDGTSGALNGYCSESEKEPQYDDRGMGGDSLDRPIFDY